ncbi:hypothetical protein [Streptomyces aureocirculatus]|uniref:hypothetical protein n=1 Tax=Streptomyces aureocirculatus TaxID=67275 RepID=UPI0004C61B0F|nr:hypothetical protein [Streptomyces aureocirculatus]
MTTADWPFGTDADRDDPLTKLRILVVTSFNPDWKYIAAYIGVNTRCYSWGSKERPTDAEAAMLDSYIDEYIHYFLGDHERQRMLKRPLYVERRVITRVFNKYAPADWGYRILTWQYGPRFLPGPPGSESRQTAGPLSLEQAMDRNHDIHPKRWLDWKAAHPEVFPT